MKTISTGIASLVWFCMATVATVTAQYEGEIRYAIYNPQEGERQPSTLNLTFTDNRIFIDSDVSMTVMSGLHARGILVRNDMDDFVLITRENEGLMVKKQDLENLVSMMNRVQGKPEASRRQPFDWENNVVETGNTRMIQGKQAYEFILKRNGDDGQLSVWLTDAIQVDWGVLMDAWYSTGTTQFEHEIPIEVVMNDKSFPLLVEARKGGNVVFRAEAVFLDDDTFDRTKTDLSPDLKLLGFTELMMNFFRQRQ